MKLDPLCNPQPATSTKSLAPQSGASPTQANMQPVLSSQQLFNLTNEVLIEHAGFTYRLRITQANKLILTK
jgi:hemin uptake protein HemP